ncbi:BTB/POZ protein [Ochromonadaceae sp. CCMP2298]|nr:BTB/POZ protein [Ochromonadaceae sp. CCMP2298]
MFAPPPPPEPSPSTSGMLKLNVGGTKFTTTYSTISNVEGMLLAMFSGRHRLTPDAEGYHFIDRDGTHFRHILNLLRFPTEFEVDLPEGELRELERELRYYGLSEAYTLARQILTPVISATSTGFDIHPSRVEDRYEGYKAYFTVGDVVLPASNRGWNVLVFDPRKNTIIAQTSYDTWEGKSPGQRCTDFLNAVPEGSIVAIAVFGDGGQNTSMDGAMGRALHSCGTCSW